MGKSYRSKFNDHGYRGRESDDNNIYVNLSEVFLSESTVQKLLDRDGGQIEEMRREFEDGRDMVRVVLRYRAGGGYNVEDGRHRVIAAKLAGLCFIEAMIVG